MVVTRVEGVGVRFFQDCAVDVEDLLVFTNRDADYLGVEDAVVMLISPLRFAIT